MVFSVMVFNILEYLLGWVSFLIVVQIILSNLIAFNVVNMHNELVRGVYRGLTAMFEPLYAPIRKIMPDFGALDLSPLVVLIVLNIITRYILPAIYVSQSSGVLN